MMDDHKGEEGGRLIGRIEIETRSAIIEVTSEEKGKAKKVRKLLADRRLNPEGKAVILHAPNYTRAAGNAVEAQDGLVTRTNEELLRLVEELDGDE
ncbi:MAG: hypothetical protein ACRD1Z_05285 [Vicinamibacteria bacterium]